MQTDTVSIEQFISANQISMTADRVDANPNMQDSRDMDHWKVTLVRLVLREGYDTFHGYKGKLGPHQYRKERLTTYFSKGYGHNGAKPTAEEVLDCLASDAGTVENTPDFEDFCSEFGYDSDSRKAEKTWKAIQHSASRLRNFLGDDLFDRLVWHTERA